MGCEGKKEHCEIGRKRAQNEQQKEGRRMEKLKIESERRMRGVRWVSGLATDSEANT